MVKGSEEFYCLDFFDCILDCLTRILECLAESYDPPPPYNCDKFESDCYYCKCFSCTVFYILFIVSYHIIFGVLFIFLFTLYIITLILELICYILSFITYYFKNYDGDYNCNCDRICFFHILTHNLYFMSNIITFILLIICYVHNPLKEECLQNKLYNWELSPIYEIYLSDEITSESIKFGELEKYSNDNIDIKSSDIYKWKNKYFNVKRLEVKVKDLEEYDYDSLSPNPISYIEITRSEYLYEKKSNHTVIKIDDNNYLHYYNEKSSSVLVDLKISHKRPFIDLKEENNICFIPSCSLKENKCQFPSIKIDSDLSDNFIKYNNIEIEVKNNIGYYKPEYFQLYRINNIKDITSTRTKKNIIYGRNLFLAFFIINIILRTIKLIYFCFLEIKNHEAYCSCFNLIIFIIHIINFSFIIALITILYKIVRLDFFYGILSLEIFGLIIGTIFSYGIFFSDEKPLDDDFDDFDDFDDNCTCECETVYCIACCSILRKKITLKKVQKKIEKIDHAINDNKKFLLEVNEEIERKINAKKLNQIHYNNLQKNLNKLKDIQNKNKDILNLRNNELEKLKDNIEVQKELKKFNEQKLKLDINCIYFDTTMDGGEESSSGYQFFKFLKNCITGVFFGIKNEEDLVNLLSGLDAKFKFVLIFKGIDKDKYLIESYSQYFSHIIIFSDDSSEIEELEYIENVMSIENEYEQVIEKLKIIIEESNKKDIKYITKYKPYKLILFSDYIIYNCKKYHLELLKNTILNQEVENIDPEIFFQGLTEEEYKDFISFINNLETVNDGNNFEFPVNDENIYNKEINDGFNIDNTFENKNLDEDDIIPKYNKYNDKREGEDEDEEEEDELREEEEGEEEEDIIPNKHRGDKRGKNKRSNDYEIDTRDDNIIITNDEIDSRKENLLSKRRKNFDEDYDSIPILNRNTKAERDTIFSTNSIKINKNKVNNSLGIIEATPKNLIKSFLQKYDYKNSENLIKLYIGENEKFYIYVNKWLMTLNINIYKKISPIVGKIMNVLYNNIAEKSQMLNNKKNITLYRGGFFSRMKLKINEPITLYRVFSIKKADIFLYKACEGDIICYPSFMSFSRDKKVAQGFAKDDKNIFSDLSKKCSCLIQLDYLIQDGCKFQAANIQAYSKYTESEILFPPFSFFKIEKVVFDKIEHNGTKQHPFEIKLKIINRHFYLDQAILDGEEFDYDKKNNMWKLRI